MRLSAAHHATKNERQQARIEYLDQQVLAFQAVIAGKNTALASLRSQGEALRGLVASQGEEHEAELRRERRWTHVFVVIAAAVTAALAGVVLRWLV